MRIAARTTYQPIILYTSTEHGLGSTRWHRSTPTDCASGQVPKFSVASASGWNKRGCRQLEQDTTKHTYVLDMLLRSYKTIWKYYWTYQATNTHNGWLCVLERGVFGSSQLVTDVFPSRPAFRLNAYVPFER